MTKKITRWALTLCLLLALSGCGAGFQGSSLKGADSYALEIEALSGSDSHSLELEQGDILQVLFETEKGSLTLAITAPDGTSLYTGNGTAATQFSLAVPMDGPYSISVEGKKAQGNIRIDVGKAPTLSRLLNRAWLVPCYSSSLLLTFFS